MDDAAVSHLRAVAEGVVAEAAALARRRRAEIMGGGSPATAVRAKSTPTDPVTVADTDTERFVRDRLAALRPGEPVLGEELGGDAPAGGAVRWVLDPIDGTVNFLYGIPAYVVSLAAQVDGVSVAGAVADISSGTVFSAAAGSGARMAVHGRVTRDLRCTAVTDLSMSLVGTGFGYDPGRRAAQAAVLARLLPRVRDIRRIGAAALDLCLVAAGALDAHYEHGLNLWDWAAGALIAQEAGAVVIRPAEPGGLLVAAAPGVADELLGALRQAGGAGPLR